MERRTASLTCLSRQTQNKLLYRWKKNRTAPPWLPCVFLLPKNNRNRVDVNCSQPQIWHLHCCTRHECTNSNKIMSLESPSYSTMSDSKKMRTEETNWHRLLWQRGELTFNLTDLNVHIHFVTYLSRNVIKKVEMCLCKDSVGCLFKLQKSDCLLFSPLSHRHVQEAGGAILLGLLSKGP